jgi:hypothetical protein
MGNKVVITSLLALLINIPASYSQSLEKWVKIFPNPIQNGALQYKTELPDDIVGYELIIIDMTGKRAFTKKVARTTLNNYYSECFNPNLTVGAYILQLIYTDSDNDLILSEPVRFSYVP